MNMLGEHPTLRELEAFVTGKLRPEADAPIDSHLDSCSQCQAELDEICADNDAFARRVVAVGSTVTLKLWGDNTTNETAAEKFDDTHSKKRTSTSSSLADNDVTALGDAESRYSFAAELGRGGMGVIYDGYDRRLQRSLVLKVLSPKLAADAEAQTRFLREARVAARLQHPNIVPVHDLGKLKDQRPFFSMRCLKGQTLGEKLKRRADPLENQTRFLELLTQVSQAVAFAHSQRVVHRDLKPDNVMIGEFGEVQVVDWGLAQLSVDSVDASTDLLVETENSTADDGQRSQTASTEHDLEAVGPPKDDRSPDPRITQAGQIMGTPTYMAPEQAMGQVERVDQRSDVYALGAMLCEILTGQPPCTDAARGELAPATEYRLTSVWQRLNQWCDDPELVSFCCKCLAAEPQDRPPDAGCVAAALRDHRESVEQRLRLMEVQRAQEQAKALERRKRLRQAGLASLLIFTLVFTIAVGHQYYQTHLQQQRQQLTSSHSAQQKLESQLTLEQDEYQRALLLTHWYDGKQLRQMLTAFRHVSQAFQPERTLSALSTELASTEGAPTLPLHTQFATQLVEAHLWVLADEETVRKETRVQANRTYEAAFTIFAAWQKPGAIPIPDAVEAVRRYPNPVQRLAILAIDDWILNAVAANAYADSELAWLSNVANRLDSDRLSIDLRLWTLRRDVDSIREYAEAVDITSSTPGIVYRCATALQQFNDNTSAQRLVDRARLVYGLPFWFYPRFHGRESETMGANSNPLSIDHTWSSVLLAARADERDGRYASALKRYAGLCSRPDLRMQLNSESQLRYVVSLWHELGIRYPAAKARLASTRSDARQAVMHGKDSRSNFVLIKAIDSVRHEPEHTASLFVELDRTQPRLAAKLFEVARPVLIGFKLDALVTKHRKSAENSSALPPIVAVNSTGAAHEQRQFQQVLTLVTLFLREGRRGDALAVAADARVIWPNDKAHAMIDEALEGRHPGLIPEAIRTK